MNITIIGSGNISHALIALLGSMNDVNVLSDIKQTLEKYNFVNAQGEGEVSRCDWVKCCGAKSSTKGVWQGVESTCSYNPSTAGITD
jgi:hypothetical protein